MALQSLLELPLATITLLVAIMLFAGIIHGTLGLGFPMIATPLLSLMFDVRTAILITLLPTVAVNLISIFHGGNWKQSVARFWPLPVYAMAGGIIGAYLIVDHDPEPYKLALASLILLYLLTGFAGKNNMNWAINFPETSMLGVGLVAGVAAGSTNVMVPILIIYALGLGLQPTAMVQVFNMTFLSGKIAQIGVFGTGELLDLQWLLTTLPLAAVAAGALFAGITIRHKIPVDTFRKIIRSLLVVTAFTLIAQFIL